MNKLISLTAAALVATTATAFGSVFTFENFSHGDNVTSVTSDDGLVTATVSATGGINQAWAFDSNQNNTWDYDLEGPFQHYGGILGDLDAGNILIIQEHHLLPDDNAGGGTLTFVFEKAVDFLGFNLFDDADVTVTSTSNSNSATFTLPVPNADGKYGVFDTGSLFLGVTDLTFSLNHSGAIDGLRFAAPVPVPAALPLLLTGVGGLTLIGRRRRKAA